MTRTHQQRPSDRMTILQNPTRRTGYVTQAMLDHFGSREAAVRYLNEGGEMFTRASRLAA